MRAFIIDYGMGNLISVQRSFELCGASVVVADDPSQLKEAARIILPGVGAFADGMSNLRDRGFEEAVRNALEDPAVKMIGICLGMQLLADFGDEGGPTKGLGLIPGKIEKLHSSSAKERIPHVGWNEVQFVREDPLLKGIPERSDFYFVHSYHFVPSCPEEHELLRTPYCGGFVSAVRRDNVYGVQFHPEKSQRLGFQLIGNFLS